MEFFGDHKIRWIGGAMDSLLGGGSRGAAKKARQLFNLLRRQAAKPTEINRRAVYMLVLDDQIIGFIDFLLEMFRREFHANYEPLKREAIWLATRSAHRGPVKLGIALLGLFQCQEQLEVLYTLGKHDEFTLYAAVAIQNGVEKYNQCLFELAKSIDGWGKINLVNRLEPDSEEIKEWLLKAGCQNPVMNEYLAYTCAVKGELQAALEKGEIDRGLYKGAGVIISALINGGPADDIDNYDQAIPVIVNYLRHSKINADELDDFLVIASIKDYLEQEAEKWEKRRHAGWTEENRVAMLNESNIILGRGNLAWYGLGRPFFQ